MSDVLDEVNGPAKRPVFLTVLCILSFIAAGFAIIGMLILGATKSVVGNNARISAELDKAFADSGAGVEATAAVATVFSWPYMLGATLLTLVGLFGVIKMWNLKKQGFMIYTATTIVGLIFPLLFGLPFSVYSAIIPIAFIVMYYTNVKHMA